MDWLKTLIEKAVITDGKLDVEGLMKSIKEEFPKNAVPKAEFNTLNETKKTLDGQLSEANKQIEAFKGMNVDDIKKTAEEYKTKFEEADKAHKAELDKIAYNSAAEKFVDGLKPKDGLSKKAILAEFAAKEFKLEGENFIGGKEWAEAFKKDNAAHFDDGNPAPGIFSGKLTETSLNMDAFSTAARKAAGLGEAKKE